MCNHRINFLLSAKMTRGLIYKSMKKALALYVLQYAKSHLLGKSDIKQWKNQELFKKNFWNQSSHYEITDNFCYDWKPLHAYLLGIVNVGHFGSGLKIWPDNLLKGQCHHLLVQCLLLQLTLQLVEHYLNFADRYTAEYHLLTIVILLKILGNRDRWKKPGNKKG